MARNFNGSSTYVDIGNVSALDFERTDPFSISSWIKTTAATGSIFAKMKNNNPYQGYELLVNEGKAKVFIDNVYSPANRISFDTQAVNNGVYRHIMLTYDGSSTLAGTEIYIDGAVQTKYNTEDSLSATIKQADSVRIGSRSAGGIHFNGDICEVAVWRANLTAKEVAALYRGVSPFAFRYSDMKGYWPMYKGGQSPEPDYSGQGNSGTVTGTTLTAHSPVQLVENYL